MGTPNENAVETVGLGMKYGRNWAVRGLEMKVPRGSVYGLLGLNGAGKSTTLRTLYGMLVPHEGRASVLGIDPTDHPVDVKKLVGYVPDRPIFYEWMTVRETIAFVEYYRKDRWDKAYAKRLAEMFRLPMEQRVSTLSKGQAAKTSLLIAMAFHPELLILDEPTGGLDPVARRDFLETLLAEYTEGGNTILISSHLITEISGLVDHVGIIQDGKLLHEGPTESLLANVKKAILTFDDAAPRTVDVPGILRARTHARELMLTINHFDAVATPVLLHRTGANDVLIQDLPLESVFVEMVSEGAVGGVGKVEDVA